jgi:DNA (cytosine-5)-methyltransferase 1
VDLFSGCGGMTLGLAEAARRAGASLDPKLAVDRDPGIAAVYKQNFGAPTVACDVELLFDRPVGDGLSPTEKKVRKLVGDLDVLMGGPPCQGHSDLNNHTRRSDPKNVLYLTMARAAEVLKPRIAVIENVPHVQRDAGNVVKTTQSALEELGYVVHSAVVDGSRIGVPQRRRRFILVASREPSVEPETVLAHVYRQETPVRTVRWAIEDLENLIPLRELDRPSRMSPDNTKRVQYLMQHRLLNLPNEERPECHRDDPNHSYVSMYGRLAWDQLAQTITTGFTSMGQGRYVHPSRPRTLTPHEAARLQTFPDWFQWGESVPRTLLSTMIGNAVPPFLMLAIGTPIVTGLLGSA